MTSAHAAVTADTTRCPVCLIPVRTPGTCGWSSCAEPKTPAHAAVTSDFTAVVLEVLRRRPDVRADEVAAVLTADPDFCAQEVIDTLDTAAADARADLAHEADLERE